MVVPGVLWIGFAVRRYQYYIPAYDRFMRQFRPKGFTTAIGRREFLGAAGAILSGCLPICAEARPKQILIFRHAEKNDNKSDIQLNARGYARAAAPPTLFPARFETPEFLFASKQSAHSNRPVETITPLAMALRLKIDNAFTNEDYAGLGGTCSGSRTTPEGRY